MKKRFLILFVMVFVIASAFALTAAAAGAADNAYGTVTNVDGTAAPTTIDSTSKVVILASDGTYYTFPSYYIIEDNSVFTWKQNTAVNEILGYSIGAQGIRSYIVRMEIPEGIVSINPNNNGGAYAFEDATRMVEVSFPTTLTLIGDHSFNRCKALVDINGIEEYIAQATYIPKQFVAETLWGEGVDLVFSETITELPERCFYGTKIKSVTFPSKLKTIGSRAFQGCNRLTSVELPASIEILKNHVFASCTSLASIDLSKCTKITSIGEYAFEYAAITSFDFGPFASTLTTMGEGILNRCYSLTTVYNFENVDGLSTVPSNTFNQCQLTEINIPKNVTSIGGYAYFGHRSNQAEVRIPNGVTSIGDHAFVRGTTGGNRTTKIYLPASLETVSGNYNFEKWHYGEMYIPANVTLPTGFFNQALASGVVFYYTGDINTITISDKTNNSAFLNAEWISADNFTGKSGDKNYIVYNYNECDAFYQGICNTAGDDGNCETALMCTGRDNCKRVSLEAKTHVEAHDVIYADGFMSAGVHKAYCSNVNCKALDEVESLAPMFTPEGYSYRIGENTGISAKFKINTKALLLYEEHEGELVFGMIIANQNHVNDTFLRDGKLNTQNNKGIQVEMGARTYSYFNCFISGFDMNNTQHTELGLVIAGYVYEKGDNSNISYLQKTYEGNTTPYSGVCERDVNLNVVTIGKVKEFSGE